MASVKPAATPAQTATTKPPLQPQPPAASAPTTQTAASANQPSAAGALRAPGKTNDGKKVNVATTGPGNKPDPSGQPTAVVAAAQSSIAAGSSAASADFDIFHFLNQDVAAPRAAILRDPVLQQMSVVRYEGELDGEGFFHGYGKLVSTLGYVYAGAFVRGLMDGTGRIEWSDGTAFEGDFKVNAIHGQGRFTWPSQDWYEGTVRNGVRNGQGTFYFQQKKQRYEGGWLDGKRHGQGTLYYHVQPPTTSVGSPTPPEHHDAALLTPIVYTGEWVDDRRTGKGTMQYPNEGFYNGEWLNDQRHGNGVMTWRKQGVIVEEYRGQWSGGLPHGSGMCTYIRAPPSTHPPGNGGASSSSDNLTGAPPKDASLAHNTYTGEFFQGQRHGFGTFVYDDGSRYEGGWVNNVKQGDGKYTTANGVVYFGQFADGHPVTPIADVKPADSTVACPLPLYIRDVFGESESNVPESVTAVQSIVSRYHGLLRKVFQHYSSLEQGVDVVTTPATWRATQSQGTLHMVQFLRLCSDAKLLNRHVTISAVDRLLLAFKDRSASTTSAVYSNGTEVTPPTTVGASGASVASGASAAPAAATGSSPKDAPPPLPSGAGRHASVASTSSTGSGRATSLHRTGQFQTPWENYRNELHQYQAELSFRDCVEALIRIAALYYRDAQYGASLAHRFKLVIDEHLAPNAATGVTAIPICPLSREHRALVAGHLPMLQRYFKSSAAAVAHSLSSGLSLPAASASRSSGNAVDLTVTLRQVGLLLKRIGCLGDTTSAATAGGGEAFTLTKLCKLVPYDRYPQMTTAILKRQFIIGAGVIRPAPPATPASGGQPDTRGGLPSPAVGAAPSAAAATFGSTLGSTQGGLLAAAHGADRSSISVDGGDGMATALLPNGGRMDDATEAIYKGKCAMQARSLGYNQLNHARTLGVETELTFCEFVETLLKVAVARGTENTPAQRISGFFLNYLVPYSKSAAFDS